MLLSRRSDDLTPWAYRPGEIAVLLRFGARPHCLPLTKLCLVPHYLDA